MLVIVVNIIIVTVPEDLVLLLWRVCYCGCCLFVYLLVPEELCLLLTCQYPSTSGAWTPNSYLDAWTPSSSNRRNNNSNNINSSNSINSINSNNNKNNNNNSNSNSNSNSSSTRGPLSLSYVQYRRTSGAWTPRRRSRRPEPAPPRGPSQGLNNATSPSSNVLTCIYIYIYIYVYINQ